MPGLQHPGIYCLFLVWIHRRLFRWCDDIPKFIVETFVTTSLGIEMEAYRIGSDADLLALENGWRDQPRVSSEGAVLIRPDGFVAWRTSSASTMTTLASSPLEQVLARILCRPPVSTHL